MLSASLTAIRLVRIMSITHQLINLEIKDESYIQYRTINHDIFIKKLPVYNFSNTSVQLLKSYLSNRKQCEN